MKLAFISYVNCHLFLRCLRNVRVVNDLNGNNNTCINKAVY